MSNKAWKTPANHDHVVALRGVEKVMLDNSVPDAFTDLLVVPWMEISSELLQVRGELSDAWVRMLWFTRKVCNSIATSLATADPEPLDHVLQTFMLWLQGFTDETGAFDQAITAAEHLCEKLRTQMTVELSQREMSDPKDIAPGENSSPHTEASAPTNKVVNDLNAQTIMMNTSETLMDMPNVSDSFNTPLNPGAEFQASSDPAHVGSKTAGAASDSLIIPVGIWLGFHDEESSMMEKLAVYDRANDNYIFSNKQGFLVRQLNTADLLHLIENELVDIIERRLVPRVSKT